MIEPHSKLKGAAHITMVMGLGAVFALMLPWNSYLSIEQINQGKEVAAISQWQQDYGKKIDYLVEKNGGNPATIVRYYGLATTTQE